MVFSCGPALGEDRDDRAIARSLVEAGFSAVPAIEDGLDSFKAHGQQSAVASKVDWLLLAYAQIRGASAFSRISGMIGDTNLVDHAIGLDNSVAVALGLTSYVSSFRGMGEVFHQCTIPRSTGVTLSPTPCVAPSREIPMEHDLRCNRGHEPKDALDKFIFAWEMGDRLLLETSLGPAARGAFDQLLKYQSWTKVRAQFWHATIRGGVVGIGYRFAVAGRWAEPEETLREERGTSGAEETPRDPVIETFLKNRSGKDCGRIRLPFSETPRIASFPEGPVKYSINTSNLTDLLRLVSSCATESLVVR